MFLDEVRIRVRSGAGGPGAVSFRREKHVPRGGPDGGSGGRGADIFLVASRGLSSLSHFKGRRVISGDRGGAGARQLRHGADAEAVRLLVPVGTVVRDGRGNEVLGELTADDSELQVATGGRGGRGNARFADSRNQAPRFAELGDPGQERELLLELRLIADVGLVGAPNAGKSTLLSALTAATPKVAGYPFTTLEPYLGVLETSDGRRLVVADVPGLIAGASHGVGLGTEFLKHLSRTSVLVHVLDCAEPLPVCRENWQAVSRELEDYDPALSRRVRVAALNKIDIDGALATALHLCQELGGPGLAAQPVSARDGAGLEELTRALSDAVAATEAPARPILRVFRPEPVTQKIRVTRKGEAFVVGGKRIEAIVARADLANPDALRRMRRQLDSAGLRDALLEIGAQHGDTVVIGKVEFLFDPDL